MKNVMIQGYMVLTQSHICFFAQLPQTDVSLLCLVLMQGAVIKSGYLYKKSQTTRRRHRYWFILKNDVLSYYDNPADLYFPSGTIDVRHAITAETDQNDEKQKGILVYMQNRSYQLRADSQASAVQWVKQLQKIIFKTRNQGNNVKVNHSRTPVDLDLYSHYQCP
jgi:sterol 3beta-glucosyltransferase